MEESFKSSSHNQSWLPEREARYGQSLKDSLKAKCCKTVEDEGTNLASLEVGQASSREKAGTQLNSLNGMEKIKDLQSGD
jgi:hypothetical protein